MEPQPEPLTAEAVRQEVRDTMMAQQTELLELANRNALELLREERKKSTPALLETITGEVQSARSHESHDWKNQINKSNCDVLRQVEQLWARTERYVDVLEVTNEQEVFKAGAMDMIQKGKALVHDRLKLIRFADREGWKAALHFEGDDIAESEAEAKRMRKSKKETEKDSDKMRRDRDRRNLDTRRDGQGSSRDRSPGRSFNRNSGYGGQSDRKFCFLCKRWGHLPRSRECPRK